MYCCGKRHLKICIRNPWHSVHTFLPSSQVQYKPHNTSMGQCVNCCNILYNFPHYCSNFENCHLPLVKIRNSSKLKMTMEARGTLINSTSSEKLCTAILPEISKNVITGHTFLENLPYRSDICLFYLPTHAYIWGQEPFSGTVKEYKLF